MPRVQGVSKSGNTVGEVISLGQSPLPFGFLLCDGAAVSEAAFPELFAKIGYTWGNPGGGDFNLPDLRGRSPMGAGQGPVALRTLGSDVGGEQKNIEHGHAMGHTHSMPTHYHRWYDDGGAGGTSQSHNSAGNNVNISGGTKSAEAAGIALCAGAAPNTRLAFDAYTNPIDPGDTNATGTTTTGNGLSTAQDFTHSCGIVTMAIAYL